VANHFPAEFMSATPHRLPGYAFLQGEGLEIGAFNHPAELPDGCSTQYFDVMSVDEARRRFPEMDPDCFVVPDFLGDLDRDGLASFEDRSFSFVILNHVLEHVANPIAVLREVCRLVSIGGHLVVSVPDKSKTFDRNREVTSWDHLFREYLEEVTEVTDEHYMDFLTKVAPEIFGDPDRDIPHDLRRARSRHEHAHVWTTDAFRAFLVRAFRLIRVTAECVHESTGSENGIEYFAVWQIDKTPGST
jgi:SAM-dependent methyltransferase